MCISIQLTDQSLFSVLKINLTHKYFYIVTIHNSAAFLTRNTSDHIGDIEGVIAKGWSICAHPVLQEELELAHPYAKFIFNQEGKELYGLIEDYDAKKCQVMAVGM